MVVCRSSQGHSQGATMGIPATSCTVFRDEFIDVNAIQNGTYALLPHHRDGGPCGRPAPAPGSARVRAAMVGAALVAAIGCDAPGPIGTPGPISTHPHWDTE